MNIKRALVPGTFDPVTRGHLAVIRMAAGIFEQVTVCILVNPDKVCMFDEQVRVQALKAATAGLANVKIAVSHGMTADFAKEIDAGVIVRGIRNVHDAAYEIEMAEFNRKRTGVETLLLPAPAELSGLSSTAVRAALEARQNPSEMLPDGIWELLKANAASFPALADPSCRHCSK